MRAFLREILWVSIAVIVAIGLFFLSQNTLQNRVIVGDCMEPNLEDGQRLVINKVVYHFHEPERGDVIVLHPPSNPNAEYIKRIIALPGESVEIKEGTVFIHRNGEVFPLDEDAYIKYPPAYTFPEQEIPEGEYFVLGDNRPVANDSHNGWTVPRQNIVGKAWILIWPPGEWRIVSNHSLSAQIPIGGGLR